MIPRGWPHAPGPFRGRYDGTISPPRTLPRRQPLVNAERALKGTSSTTTCTVGRPSSGTGVPRPSPPAAPKSTSTMAWYRLVGSSHTRRYRPVGSSRRPVPTDRQRPNAPVPTGRQCDYVR
jgi:hypothetical protein